MSKPFFYFLPLSLIFLLASCQEDNKSAASENPSIALHWELNKNEPDESGNPLYYATFTLTNKGDEPIGRDWTIFFNQILGPQTGTSLDGLAQLEQINGDFFRMSPTAAFKSLAPGAEVKIHYIGANWAIKESDAPAGLYIVAQNSDGQESQPFFPVEYTIGAFNKSEQLKRVQNDNFPVPTNTYRYEQNASLIQLPKDQLPPFVPAPVTVIDKGGVLELDENYAICYFDGLEKEAAFLQEALQNKGIDLKLFKEGSCDVQGIRLSVSTEYNNLKKPEGYSLEVSPDKDNIDIKGNDAAGVFYGVQSLLALLEPGAAQQNNKSLNFPGILIEDEPRFPYRGLHFDVSRNFHGKESVKKMLDLMAAYKLNKFHFHLTDDEGWRLEIPTLPELTEVGSKRGHTLNETNHLQPAYGSGPFVDNPNTTGSGYYSTTDYIEIIQYAHDRHIEVIPEIDLPGHARAAIIAMKARYNRLEKNGETEEAKKYLLHDPEDESVYSSAQNYKDNVVCVCQESVYTFIEEVVDALINMHQEANVPLSMVHTGGDEVPSGVWDKSPVCEAFLVDNPEVKSGRNHLTQYFTGRFADILNERNLITAGWEEIGLSIEDDEHGHHIRKPNPKFVSNNFMPFVWNAVFGWGGEDIAYQLANLGYPVVLCNASNLYFDLAYGKDPEDAGLYWAGFVDTKKAFEFVPLDLFKSAEMGKFGESLDPEELAKGKIALKPSSFTNVKGIQGQLWSEALTSTERLELAAFPKILGLAERAWAARPSWAKKENTVAFSDGLGKAWNQFSNTLGQKEFERLDYMAGGVGYRIPPPGAKLENGKLQANTAFPGLSIRYTEDGSEPTVQSKEYTGPIAVKGDVRLKVFSKGGNSSRSILVKKELVN